MIIKKIRAIFTLIQMIITVSTVIVLMYLFNKNHHKIRRIWAKMQMKLLGITLKVKGEIDPTAQMVVMNHQSVLDIIVVENLHPRNLCWVAKSEIGDIPWFGRILKAPKMIAVQRESKSSLVKLIKDCKVALDDKRPIAIFPEGTRTDGRKIRNFKTGAKIIADKYNLKVQPIVLVHTIDILDSKNLSQQSGEVEVVFLPSVEASKETNWYEKVEEDMNTAFYKELNNGN